MEPDPDPVAAGASSSPPPSPAPATSSLFPDHQIAATEPNPVAAGASSSPPPSPAPATSPPSSPAPATSPIFPDHQIEPMEPHQVAAGASSSPPATSHHSSDHQIAPMEPHPVAVGASSSPPPSPAPATSHHFPDHQIVAMELQPAAAEVSSTQPISPAPEASPPSSPAPAASPPRQTRDDDERAAVECTDLGEEVNPVPPAPQQQHATAEDDAVGTHAEEEQPNKEASEGAGEAFRRFMEKFVDQQEDSIILSPWLKEISTHDHPAVLHFLGEKYNNLMERYKKQLVKCSEECEPRYNEMKKKYADECAERRRLYNEIIELKGNIRVFCRCRPLSPDEVTRGCLPVVEIDPSQENELQFVPTEKEKKPFKFDHVFGPEDDQEAVFSETVPVIRSVMDGFNVCIFAYGQTGTGKTFTMEGVPENRGVNYRALEELFRISEQRSASVAYTFSVSILEVYNEKIRDLLDESNDQSKRLDIKQNADGIQEVHGLVEAPVYNIDGVWEKLKLGAQNRSVGSTNANELSSRSHSLVRVTVRSEHLVTCQRSRSHMWLIDLAGSERIAKTGAEGDRLKESQFINKSLSALGDVISALASKNSHIPYRNSKLTHLLQSSLGGDCKTLMFVQISPSSKDSGETLSSLNFASRVRSVEHGPVRKQVDPTETLKFKQMSEKLLHEEKENVQLNQKLQMMQLKYNSRENVFRSLNEKVKDAEQACRNYQQRIRELEVELANEKRASRDSARSSRPPLVPPRQRRHNSNIPVPPSGPSRWRLKASIHNKENIPVAMNKSNPVDDPSKVVSRARRVSLPTQPKRRSSMAILPSVREPEHLSVINEKRAGSRLSQVHWPRRSLASFGVNLVPGTPIGGHDGHVDATPDAAKFRRFDVGSCSSKFTSPPNDVGMPPAGGPANAPKSKVVSRARLVSLTPVIRQIPIQPKRRSSMAIPEHLSVLNENRAVSRLPQVHWPRRSVASFGGHDGPVDATPDAAKFRRFDVGSSSSKFTSPPNVGMSPAGGPANAPKLCFSIQKRVAPLRVRAQPALGIFDPTLRANMLVAKTGFVPPPRRVLNPKRRQSVL